MCFAPQRRALFRHFFDIWTSKSGPRPSVFNTFDLEMCFAPQRRALFRHRNFQKWSDHGVLYILTWKCASRHNGVHFFIISTSKSGPKLVCFVHFDLEMCFAPQRRALFRHLNFQKWSENGVFCTFWLGNVLRATTACTFSSLIWPAGSAPAALASLLFDPPGSHKSLEKHCVSRLSYLFAHLHLLSSDLFSSDSSHLCFSTVHIVGSFTSKLPSMISMIHDICLGVSVQTCKHQPQKNTIPKVSRYISMCKCSKCMQMPILSQKSWPLMTTQSFANDTCPGYPWISLDHWPNTQCKPSPDENALEHGMPGKFCTLDFRQRPNLPWRQQRANKND